MWRLGWKTVYLLYCKGESVAEIRCRMEIRWQSGAHSRQAWQGIPPLLQMLTTPQIINPNQTIIFKYGWLHLSKNLSMIGKSIKLKDLISQILKIAEKN